MYPASCAIFLICSCFSPTTCKPIHLFTKSVPPNSLALSSKILLLHFQIGKGITLRDGSDCTIAACGITVRMALDAAESLQQEGISCRVLDMFSIKPIDNKILEKAARETGCIVTTEEHNIFGGMGSAVAESVSESYPVPIKRIGAQDMFGESARDNEVPLLLEKHGITSFNMVKQVKEIRNKKL